MNRLAVGSGSLLRLAHLVLQELLPQGLAGRRSRGGRCGGLLGRGGGNVSRAGGSQRGPPAQASAVLLVLLVAARQQPRRAGPNLSLSPPHSLQRRPRATPRPRQAAAGLVLAVVAPPHEALEEAGGQPPGVLGACREPG